MIEKLLEQIQSDILTDELKLTLSTLFESNLNEAIKHKELELEETNRKEIVEFRDELSTQVDEYLTYIVEEFVKENKQSIVESVKVKASEKVLGLFEELVQNFHMELSDEVEVNEAEVAGLKEEINTLTAKITEAKKETQTVMKAAIIAEKCQTLITDLEKDKLVELAESITFEEESFAKKLDVLVEGIVIARAVITPEKIVEGVEDPKKIPAEKVPTATDKYLKYL